MHILPLWNPNNKWHFEVSLRTHHFWKVSLGLKSLKVSFSVMWPQYQPIGTLEILKSCEISWDLLKKYFHLKSNAVYNSSAKNAQIITKRNLGDIVCAYCSAYYSTYSGSVDRVLYPMDGAFNTRTSRSSPVDGL